VRAKTLGRGLLVILLTVTTLAFSSCANIQLLKYSFTEKTPANKALRAFPSQIPGAYGVYKIEVPEASHCLVHITQIHYVNGISEEEMKEIEKVQNNIYQILDYIINYLSLKKVYQEGKMKDPDVFNTLLNFWDETLNEMFNQLISLSEIDSGEINTIVAESLKEKERSKEYYQKTSAVSRLVNQRKLKTMASERASEAFKSMMFNYLANLYQEPFLTKTISVEMIEEISNALKEAIEDREDVLLDIICQNNDTLAVTVYGAGHDWEDNIAKWNLHHPKHKFSFIKVIPESASHLFILPSKNHYHYINLK